MNKTFDRYICLKALISNLSPQIQQLTLLTKSGSTVLQIFRVLHLIRALPKCQIYHDFRNFYALDKMAVPFIIQSSSEEYQYKHFKNLTKPSLRINKDYCLSIKLPPKLLGLKSLTFRGRFSLIHQNNIILLLKKLAKLTLDYLEVNLNSDEDLFLLTSSMAAFISLQKSLKSIHININYHSKLYNDSFIQSVLYLSSLQVLKVSLNKWDSTSVLEIMAHSLGNLTQLKEFCLEIEDRNLKVEPSTWKVFGNSMNSLKQLEKFSMKLPNTCEAYYGIALNEVKCLPRLQDLLLHFALYKNDSRYAKMLFEKLKSFKALKRLTLFINFECPQEIHPKILHAFISVGKDLAHVKQLILRLGRLDIKAKVLSSLTKFLLC